MVAGFCPLLLFSSFFFPPSFSFRMWVFCLCVRGVEARGTKTRYSRRGMSKRHSDHRINYPTFDSENIGIRKEQGGVA